MPSTCNDPEIARLWNRALLTGSFDDYGGDQLPFHSGPSDGSSQPSVHVISHGPHAGEAPVAGAAGVFHGADQLPFHSGPSDGSSQPSAHVISHGGSAGEGAVAEARVFHGADPVPPHHSGPSDGSRQAPVHVISHGGSAGEGAVAEARVFHGADRVPPHSGPSDSSRQASVPVISHGGSEVPVAAPLDGRGEAPVISHPNIGSIPTAPSPSARQQEYLEFDSYLIHDFFERY